jgi:hypothetical protein
MPTGRGADEQTRIRVVAPWTMPPPRPVGSINCSESMCNSLAELPPLMAGPVVDGSGIWDSSWTRADLSPRQSRH